jgi:hypothetical protein
MRVRILKQVASFKPGDVKDVPDELADKWCKAGLAMQDKSLDGGKEVKCKHQ